MSGQVSSDRLKSKTSRNFLSIEDISVLILLHHLHLAHLAILLSLHFLPLLIHSRQVSLLSKLNLLVHPLFVQLTVQDTFVGVLDFILVHALLLNLLLGLYAAILLPHSVLLFILLFLFLLPHCEIIHVLLVDECLFIDCSILMSKVALLVCVPRIIFELGHQGKVASRLA